MPTLSLADKRDLLLAYERLQARKLARKVIDKPKPPLWMILVPVFFVFFAWKMKAYKNGINSFSDDWMIARERCLDAAYDAAEDGTGPRLETIVRAAGNLPPDATPQYREWITLQTQHYLHLLAERGKDAHDLIRHFFRNKSAFLLTLNQISRVENSYHKALLPTLQGDPSDLEATIERIKQSGAELQREQADQIFS